MDEEEDFYHIDRKEGKKERKIAKKTDRSQYKKTDINKIASNKAWKLKKHGEDQDLIKGLVLSIRPEAIYVQSESSVYKCTLRGSLKKEKGQATNLIAIGDQVFFHPHQCTIWAIDTRKSVLSKQSSFHKNKEQYIACNLDYVIITASCHKPALNPSLIDHYIIATRKGNMNPVIVINKIDLLTQKNSEYILYHEALSIYKSLGFPILGLSVHTNEGIEELKKILMNHASVFAGESGVGKSSLINKITGSELPTKDIAEKIWRGTHTTTNASLIPLEGGGWCVDTPGIQKFGIWDLQKEDLEIYFPEFNTLKTLCYYPNCTHAHEPQCAVRDALEKGDISRMRYQSYISLIKIHSEEQNH